MCNVLYSTFLSTWSGVFLLGWNENLQPHGPLLDQFDTPALHGYSLKKVISYITRDILSTCIIKSPEMQKMEVEHTKKECSLGSLLPLQFLLIAWTL